ncbi:MAG: SDR family NAD(P)-dependent oxidoreductase, partial [Rhodospirillaceae bacterium]|nr:SDR family NAD(P)-dependent oxidoreductase [Rhodospirillaceae bacterium]
MTVLVTGAAGFIGFHTARRLLADGETVVGIDNFNAYYDTELKESRWSILAESDRFQGERLNIADRAELEAFFNNIKPTRVVHLAAQAGVRHGVDHPHEYA